MQGFKYGFFEMFGWGFEFFAKNFSIFFKELFLPITMQVIGLLLSVMPVVYLTKSLNLSGEALVPYVVPIIILLIFGLILYTVGFWKYLLQFCYLTLASRDYFSEKYVDILEYKKDISKRNADYAKMLLWATLYGVLILFIGIFIATVFLSLKTSGGRLLAILCYVATIVSLIIYSLKIFPTVPIFALEENIAPKEVIKRSFEISKNSLLLIFATQFLLGIVALIFNILFPIVTIPVKFLCGNSELMLTIYYVIVTFAQFFLLPLYSSVGYLLYCRLVSK